MAKYDAISEDRIAELIQLIPASSAKPRTFKKICEEAGIDYINALKRISASESLGQLYAQARKDYILARAESLGQLEDETRNEIKELTDMRQASAMVQLARLKADNIKWEAERVLRTIYGHQVQVDHQGAVNFSIKGLDSDTEKPQTPGK